MGAASSRALAATASIPLAAGAAGLSLPAAGIFGAGPIALAAGTAVLALPAAGLLGAGMAVGVGVGMALAKTPDLVNDALDSVCNAAEAVIDYLRTAASRAWDKLKAAAAVVKEKVLKLLRRLRGRKEAAAAKREVDRAAAAQDAAQDVLSRASARVGRVQALQGSAVGRLQDVKAGLPNQSSAIISATAPGGALALPASVAAPAARAARRASEMMTLLGTVEAALGYSIPEAARPFFCVVVTAVGIGLEAIAAAAALDA